MSTLSDSEDIQSFERRSGTYESSFLQALFFDRIHWAALNQLPRDLRPESIVDVGCGTGRLLRKAAARWPGARLAGVDPAEGMVAVARQLMPGAEFRVGRAEALPLPDDSADVVVSTASFHHWSDQAEGLRQVTRVLRPRGFFCLADIVMPYGLSVFSRHGRQTPPTILRAMFVRAGMVVHTQRRHMSGFLLVTVGEKPDGS